MAGRGRGRPTGPGLGFSARRRVAGRPAAVQEPAGPRSPARRHPGARSPPPQPVRCTGWTVRLTRRPLPRRVTGHRAAGKAMTCGDPPRAQYVSRRVSRRHVSAGQRRMRPRPPEPGAQVRILPGAQFRDINSNILTILTRRSPGSVTCGFATAQSCLPPRALPGPRPLLLWRRSWHIAISAYEAVALLSQVGTPSPTQREHRRGQQPRAITSTTSRRVASWRPANRLWEDQLGADRDAWIIRGPHGRRHLR